ncbi:MAG: TRC40/GET3/ArsA family transport-energizing ATPase [Nitrospirae bacterium]|nr:TRC40/GET3/ArsA family transport-energizing ATPase [Nitrospirota bacterium]MCL5421141.1 TRC40/GET3/ArsA family transport-energizing ATPase [Nitrospirota bacterium]
MTEYIFFSGKGGVGKTTMASATAIHYALSGKRTLIVTTDPASNLADVFEQEIGHRIVPIKGINNLFAMEIDPDEATREYKERIIEPFREIMPEDVIASLEENLSGPCTTEMASFDRFIDFMDIDEYDIIVFDTAPTGHTIRLLELPVDWSRHIEESTKMSGQTCLGPVQAIQEAKDKYDRATVLLKDPWRTKFIFVMRPEKLSLYETLRASKELEAIGIKSGEIIINGILPEEVCEVGFFRKKYEDQQKVIKETEVSINRPRRYMFLRDNEIKGIHSLKGVAGELFNGKKPSVKVENEIVHQSDFSIGKPDINQLLLPGRGRKAIFFTGKGGVGKTSISCTAALYISQRGFRTLLVTTDPAAHIGEVLDIEVGSEPTKIADNLDAVMIDQEEAFSRYRERVLSDAKGKYSDDMLAAMEEELNSPCTEEMAAFDRFIQFIESRDYEAVIFDTAPTGHTLRLLDLPFDYARQVEMMIATGEGAEVKEVTQNRFKHIIEMLRDKEKTVFSLVLYPELTPIMESYRAMGDLKEAGIETQLVVANMVLPVEVCTNDFFRNRRKMQIKYLEEIKDVFNLPILQFPLMQDEIKGIDALKKALVFYQ